MELLGLSAIEWGFVVLVVVPLAQLPLVVYLSWYVELSDGAALGHAIEFRDRECDFEADPGTDTRVDTGVTSVTDEYDRAVDRCGGSTSGNARDANRSRSTSGVSCPACGVENGVGFTFCRSCVTRLSGPRSARAPSPPQ
jgi:hypothetical protein